jgi:methylmalonyl-CoA/ethylmalonyl-CoA epimerase
MNKPVAPKKISHIGIAVENLERSIHWYQEVLGLQLEGVDIVESEQVRVAFFRIGESRIELLEPLSKSSSIAHFLVEKGEGIHHIAFEVDGISQHLNNLSQKGVQLIHEQPKQGAHQNLIAFLHPKSTGRVLIELCEPIPSEKE